MRWLRACLGLGCQRQGSKEDATSSRCSSTMSSPEIRRAGWLAAFGPATRRTAGDGLVAIRVTLLEDRLRSPGVRVRCHPFAGSEGQAGAPPEALPPAGHHQRTMLRGGRPPRATFADSGSGPSSGAPT
eukprot:scaffold11629_cov63-Phaeocystis_antarctica.AAC.3